jgi:hypothetical protein
VRAHQTSINQISAKQVSTLTATRAITTPGPVQTPARDTVRCSIHINGDRRVEPIAVCTGPTNESHAAKTHTVLGTLTPWMQPDIRQSLAADKSAGRSTWPLDEDRANLQASGP